MKKIRHYIALAGMLLAALPHMAAQETTDAIRQNIDSMLTVCRHHDLPQCNEQACRWAAGIDPQQLPQYVLTAERQLYAPPCDSHERTLYRALVARLLANGGDDITLLRYRYQYGLLSQNNEGEKATDFTFTDTAGREHHLYEQPACHTLLIFNDPDCEECHALRQALLADSTINQAIQRGNLAILVIYPDLPPEGWAEAMQHYPPSWSKGYAEEVSDLYDVRQLPVTYLLDAQRTILLRDAPVAEIAAYMQREGNP